MKLYSWHGKDDTSKPDAQVVLDGILSVQEKAKVFYTAIAAVVYHIWRVRNDLL